MATEKKTALLYGVVKDWGTKALKVVSQEAVEQPTRYLATGAEGSFRWRHYDRTCPKDEADFTREDAVERYISRIKGHIIHFRGELDKEQRLLREAENLLPDVSKGETDA